MSDSKLRPKKQKYKKLSPSESENADKEELPLGELPPGRLYSALSAAFELLMFGVFAILLMGFMLSFFGMEAITIPWTKVEVTNFDHKLALLGLMVCIHRSIVSRWRPKES